MTNDAQQSHCTRFLHGISSPPVFLTSLESIDTEFQLVIHFVIVMKTLICQVQFYFCPLLWLIHFRWPSSPAMTSTCLHLQGNPSNWSNSPAGQPIKLGKFTWISIRRIAFLIIFHHTKVTHNCHNSHAEIERSVVWLTRQRPPETLWATTGDRFSLIYIIVIAAYRSTCPFL